MISLTRDDVRSLSAHDLLYGEWLDMQSCAVFLGQLPAKGAALVRKKGFPPPGLEKDDGSPLWRLPAVSAWAGNNIRAEPATKETCLYRHFNANGTLLYVGISLCHAQRTRAHRHLAEWFRDVQNITVEWHATRADAEEAELAAILSEAPIHNQQGRQGTGPSRSDAEKFQDCGKRKTATRAVSIGGRGRN